VHGLPVGTLGAWGLVGINGFLQHRDSPAASRASAAASNEQESIHFILLAAVSATSSSVCQRWRRQQRAATAMLPCTPANQMSTVEHPAAILSAQLKHCYPSD
jgi:hypothetical protein